MINFEFWTFSKKKNSTKQPSTEGTIISVNLKHPTSIESPTLLIEGFNLEFNYARGLGHYYFVSNITFINNSLVEVELVQDVLATYKNEIGLYNAFVERSASNYNNMIYDRALTQTEDIVNKSTASTSLGLNTTGIYLVRIVGKQGIADLALSEGGITSLMARAYDKTIWEQLLGADWGKGVFNPFQYILSVMWFPFSGESELAHAHFAGLGWGDIPEIPNRGAVAYDPLVKNVAVSLPTNIYTDFRRYNNEYSKYSIYIPACGSISLDASQVDDLNIDFYVDFISGGCTAKIKNGDSIVSILDGKIGVPIQIGSSVPPNAQLMSTALSSLPSTVAAAGLAASGNIAAAGVTLGGTIAGVIEGETKAFNQPPRSCGSVGNCANLIEMPNIIVSLENIGSREYPTNVYGRPYNGYKQINTLSGFVKCQNASIEIDALFNDVNEVNAYLNSGFYYE